MKSTNTTWTAITIIVLLIAGGMYVYIRNGKDISSGNIPFSGPTEKDTLQSLSVSSSSPAALPPAADKKLLQSLSSPGPSPTTTPQTKNSNEQDLLKTLQK